MATPLLTVRTGDREGVRDLTPDCRGLVAVRAAVCCTCSSRMPPPGSRSSVLGAAEPPAGTWQSVALVDLDVDSEVRTVRLSLLRG
jgi:hypothetical protein